MVKKGARYTPEEAMGRIPDVAKHLALECVGLVIALESYPVQAREIESRVWSLTGQVGYLARLFHTVWKDEGLKRYARGGPVERQVPIKGAKAFKPPPTSLGPGRR